MSDAKTLGAQSAYPANNHRSERGTEWVESVEGMTLRQHFAGLAMQGIIAAQETTDTRHCAAYAIGYADALLAELAKESK